MRIQYTPSAAMLAVLAAAKPKPSLVKRQRAPKVDHQEIGPNPDPTLMVRTPGVGTITFDTTMGETMVSNLKASDDEYIQDEARRRDPKNRKTGRGILEGLGGGTSSGGGGFNYIRIDNKAYVSYLDFRDMPPRGEMVNFEYTEGPTLIQFGSGGYRIDKPMVHKVEHAGPGILLEHEPGMVPRKEGIFTPSSQEAPPAKSQSKKSIEEVAAAFKALETRDYQKRGGDRPREGTADTIHNRSGATKAALEFSFKNTPERLADRWVRSFLREKGLPFNTISSYQTGDYENDWVEVYVTYTGADTTPGEWTPRDEPNHFDSRLKPKAAGASLLNGRPRSSGLVAKLKASWDEADDIDDGIAELIQKNPDKQPGEIIKLYMQKYPQADEGEVYYVFKTNYRADFWDENGNWKVGARLAPKAASDYPEWRFGQGVPYVVVGGSPQMPGSSTAWPTTKNPGVYTKDIAEKIKEDIDPKGKQKVGHFTTYFTVQTLREAIRNTSFDVSGALDLIVEDLRREGIDVDGNDVR